MMGSDIFLPMLATMGLTALVWFYMYARRIPAMYKAGKHAQTYTTPDAVVKHLPAEVNFSANNFNNLCQLPMLFYALCLYIHVSTSVDSVYVVAAWAYFALRTLHSINHCTRNIVILRFYLYAASALVLWFMLGRALIAGIGVYL